jgi:predicted dehydrogenase
MSAKLTGRRDFLIQAGTMGSLALMAGLPQGGAALGAEPARVVADTVLPAEPEAPPKYHVKFAVCGMSHDHVYGMIGAIQRGGGELVAAWGGEADKLAAFTGRYPDQYGGILCDIGSHQIDRFLFYTGSQTAEVAAAQIANVRHPEHPRFQDFGDMVLRGDRGLGYVRLDWFTPDGLGTWGDGRLFLLGTDGYIEVRPYTNVAVKDRGNNLFLVDRQGARYFDCNRLALPFGPEFVADVVNRTHLAQDQEQCLLAAELAVRAQRKAAWVTLKG